MEQTVDRLPKAGGLARGYPQEDAFEAMDACRIAGAGFPSLPLHEPSSTSYQLRKRDSALPPISSAPYPEPPSSEVACLKNHARKTRLTTQDSIEARKDLEEFQPAQREFERLVGGADGYVARVSRHSPTRRSTWLLISIRKGKAPER